MNMKSQLSSDNKKRLYRCVCETTIVDVDIRVLEGWSINVEFINITYRDRIPLHPKA